MNLRRIAILIFCSCFLGCGKKKGKSLGLPAIEPPIKRNTPAGLNGTSTGLLDMPNDPPLSRIKERMFSGGPTDIKQSVQMIDGSIALMDKEAKEFEHACTKESPIDIALSGTLPQGEVFPLKLQCLKTNSSGEQIAFGVADDQVYFWAKFFPNGSIDPFIIFAKEDLGGSQVEFWTVTSKKDEKTSTLKNVDSYNFVHGIASDSEEKIELTTGGKYPGMGINCGIHMMANGSFVQAEGTFAAFEYPEGEDCSNSSGKTQATSVCGKAGDLVAASDSDCLILGSAKNKTLTFTGTELVGGFTNATKFGEQDLSSVTSFEKEAK